MHAPAADGQCCQYGRGRIGWHALARLTIGVLIACLFCCPGGGVCLVRVVWPACIGEGAGCRCSVWRQHDGYGAAVCPQERGSGDRLQTDNSMARQTVVAEYAERRPFSRRQGTSTVARTARASCCCSPAAERFRMEVWGGGAGARKKAPAGQGPLVTEETARTSTCRPCRPCRPCHQAWRERPSWVRACR